MEDLLLDYAHLFLCHQNYYWLILYFRQHVYMVLKYMPTHLFYID
uniref:Uncharacterized protein n=1 Tax=Klebsiella pneumoniae TaxID=573 RepID=A0A6M3HEJ8_KLEPN|nr:hypothetical protein [Klebsiella pneumoniae]